MADKYLTLDDIKSALDPNGEAVRSFIYERKQIENLHASLTIDTRIIEFEENKDTIDSDTLIFRALPFMFSKEAIFECLRHAQPKSYAALMSGSDFYIIVSEFESFPDEWDATHYTFIMCAGRVIETYFVLPNTNTVFSGSLEKNLFPKPYLGTSLTEAYYGCIEGFSLVDEFPFSALENYALPAPINRWLPLDTFLMRALNGNDEYFSRKVILKSLKSLIDYFASHFLQVKKDKANKSKNDPLISLRCWIISKQTGDLVIIQVPQDESEVLCDASGQPHIYHMKADDWRSFKRIKSPIAVIDDYVSSVLENRASSFDFTPHLVAI